MLPYNRLATFARGPRSHSMQDVAFVIASWEIRVKRTTIPRPISRRLECSPRKVTVGQNSKWKGKVRCASRVVLCWSAVRQGRMVDRCVETVYVNALYQIASLRFTTFGKFSHGCYKVANYERKQPCKLYVPKSFFHPSRNSNIKPKAMCSSGRCWVNRDWLRPNHFSIV